MSMESNAYKKYLAFFVGIAAAVTVGVIWLNWSVDPLQFYRKATYPPYLLFQKRFQNPGLARNYPYDSVILGTSLSENFPPNLVKERLGWTTMNFAMSGASAYEQSKMLNVALRTGKVRNVVWDVNYEYLRGDTNWVSNFDGAFPNYFYDENPWNELNNYLLNVDTTKNSFRVSLRKCGIKAYREATIDDLQTFVSPRPYKEESVRQAWQRAVKRRGVITKQVPEYAITNLNANFDEHFAKAIQAHPDVKFHLFFPPFTVGYYANIAKISPELFNSMLASRAYIYERTRNLPNVEVYDFQTDASIITNLNHYSDLMHFDTEISGHILDSIKQRQRLFTQPGSEDLRELASDESARIWIEKYGGH
jgi:hypothetical protein